LLSTPPLDIDDIFVREDLLPAYRVEEEAYATFLGFSYRPPGREEL
jgi:hypothetical protein